MLSPGEPVSSPPSLRPPLPPSLSPLPLPSRFLLSSALFLSSLVSLVVDVLFFFLCLFDFFYSLIRVSYYFPLQCISSVFQVELIALTLM